MLGGSSGPDRLNVTQAYTLVATSDVSGRHLGPQRFVNYAVAGAVFAVPVLAFVNSFVRALTADTPEELTERTDHALEPGGAEDETAGSHRYRPSAHDDAALASEADAGTRHGDDA